ncbi:putative calmodulin-dependent protein kinase type 1 [Rhizoclosmatium globosum]|uniref:Putative calmodulin-dependent protein kinase type 1 n=1 Tax=Rhizoclosmatium globosum TaxID=329046 RepID=A0A1Y2CHR9_9FUNG|nr:putative calmodulin-dependent protein kinase type 1 [Rhizoclosmatium globosum]|eukprot:ORY46588.1 putative calmodulin-dependent protein kinase type 1 [Rhizoclosmatium globosum]
MSVAAKPLAPCDYKTGRTLGQGSFAVVKEAIKLSTGEKFALKVINKKHMKGREHLVRNEVGILQKVSKGHNHIVTLYEYFETPNSLYLVMDLCTGGELFEWIMEKGTFYEEDAAEIIRTVVDCVAYLHAQNVVHRDIKPENLLFRNKNSLSELMIADFGLSKTLDPENTGLLLQSTVGTPGYMAPEILRRQGHGKPVDMWAIGVMTYFLLCGYFPFAVLGSEGADFSNGVDRVLRADFAFEPKEYWMDISPDAKDFISRLIRLNPDERMTAADALQHSWMGFAPIQGPDGASVGGRIPTIDLLPSIGRQFSKKASTLRKGASAKTNPDVVVDNGVPVSVDGGMDGVEYVNKDGP